MNIFWRGEEIFRISHENGEQRLVDCLWQGDTGIAQGEVSRREKHMANTLFPKFDGEFTGVDFITTLNNLIFGAYIFCLKYCITKANASTNLTKQMKIDDRTINERSRWKEQYFCSEFLFF